ncbi:MAG: M1 family aminopeptidase, partial [Gemmatimonadota bacterium]
QPLITAPTEVRTLYWNGYQKPALMMRLLREEVLGPEGFDRAFREYVRRWAYRHPQPADFFRTMENVSGRDLDWYWRDWVYTTARLDQAIDSVTAPPPAPGRTDGRTVGAPLAGTVRIVLSNRREMVMPAELRLTYDDGSSETRRLPVEIWNLGGRFALTVDPLGKRLVSAELDPRQVYPDVNRANNRWPAASQRQPASRPSR